MYSGLAVEIRLNTIDHSDQTYICLDVNWAVRLRASIGYRGTIWGHPGLPVLEL